jgi:hypothetical protein
MTNRLLNTLALVVACTAVAVPAGAQGTAKPATATTSTAKPAPAAKDLRLVEVLPMTCAEAWAASGRSYTEMFRIMAAMATLSLNNRELIFPNTKEAGDDAGRGIAEDCKADPDALLYAVVDKQVRRVAEAARR